MAPRVALTPTDPDPAPDAHQPTVSFDAALRHAIESRGLSLDRLRARLAARGIRVGVTTLSYWQRGLRRPERPDSLRAVAALEEILDVPPHTLTVLLGPPRPRGGAVRFRPDVQRYARLMPSPEAMNSLLAQVDMAAAGRVHIACELDTVEIGADRAVHTTSVTQVVRAHQPRADRTVAIFWDEPGSDMSAVEVRALRNCRLGRVRRDPTAGLVVAELLFDVSLHAEDTYLMCYQLLDSRGIECREILRAFRFPAEQYVLQINFDPATIPVRCYRVARPSVDQPETRTTEVTLDRYHSAHLLASQPRTGLVGIRWDWT